MDREHVLYKNSVMTQVDFYVLQKGSAGDRYRLACRIADKARTAGHRVVVHTRSAEEARHMDRLLWTFQEQSFLPHGLLGEAVPAINPVLIGDAEQAPEEHEVLINLAMETPTFFSRFERLAECVDNDDVARSASRERYRFYRDRGYPLNLHEIT
jgi:DNA polymerase-3 subunit chi